MARFLDHNVDSIVILTGAGVSAESGLATFREAGGLWENHDPMEIATPQAFARNPGLVYRFYNARRRQLGEVSPNAAHRALARLQRDFAGEVFLVTQNVDDLHERAGSTQVCHMHGELQRGLCLACGTAPALREDIDARSTCRRCGARGKLRPDIVWFGEIPYHMEEIGRRLATCDLFVAVGTSGVVYPAAGFVREALRAGAVTVEVNRDISEITRCFHLRRQGMATTELPRLVDELLAACR